MTSHTGTNGLAAWRERQRIERAYKLARLEELRRDAVEVERDGRVYRVVRIPDSYDFTVRVGPAVQLRGQRRQRAA